LIDHVYALSFKGQDIYYYRTNMLEIIPKIVNFYCYL